MTAPFAWDAAADETWKRGIGLWMKETAIRFGCIGNLEILGVAQGESSIPRFRPRSSPVPHTPNLAYAGKTVSAFGGPDQLLAHEADHEVHATAASCSAASERILPVAAMAAKIAVEGQERGAT